MQRHFFYLCLSFFSLLFLSCTDKKKSGKSEKKIITSAIQIDSNLRDALSFRFMDDDPVKKLASDDSFIYERRKTYVEYFSIDDKKGWIANFSNLDIRATYHGDSIALLIFVDGYWTRYGLNISMKGNRFQTTPFESTDVVYEREPNHITEQQKLIIQKAKYSKGDSIYGYLYSRHLREDGYKIYFRGYFRVKVE